MQQLLAMWKWANECSVWFNAVVRGDVNSVRIGNKVNIQDNVVIHCTYEKQKQLSAIMFP